MKKYIDIHGRIHYTGCPKKRLPLKSSASAACSNLNALSSQ